MPPLSQPVERPIFHHDEGNSQGGAFQGETLDSLLGRLGVKKGDLDSLFQAAVGTQLDTRNQLLGILENFGEGARASLEQDFQTQENNLLGRLEQRGLGGSSIAASTGAGFERERQLALGSLNDQLLSQRLGVVGDTGQSMAGLFSGLGELEFNADLQRDLLRDQQSNQPVGLKESANVVGGRIRIGERTGLGGLVFRT